MAQKIIITLSGILVYSLLRYLPNIMVLMDQNHAVVSISFWDASTHMGYFRPGIFGGASEFALWFGVFLLFARFRWIQPMFVHQPSHRSYPIVMLTFILFSFYFVQILVLSLVGFINYDFSSLVYVNNVLIPFFYSILLVFLVGSLIYWISRYGIGNGILILFACDVALEMYKRNLNLSHTSTEALTTSTIPSVYQDYLFLFYVMAMVLATIPYLIFRKTIISEKPTMVPHSLHLLGDPLVYSAAGTKGTPPTSSLENVQGIALWSVFFLPLLLKQELFENLLIQVIGAPFAIHLGLGIFVQIAGLFIMMAFSVVLIRSVLRLYFPNHADSMVSDSFIYLCACVLGVVSLLWNAITEEYPAKYMEVLVLVEAFILIRERIPMPALPFLQRKS